MSSAIPPREPLLSVRDLTVSYGSLKALDGVDLEVGAGEVVALAGENGAGKSTLVRCIAGEVAAGGGSVVLGGHKLRLERRAPARRSVAVVWQDLALCDNLDVASNLLLGRESPLMMLSASRFHARAAAILAELGIPLADTTALAGNLSGGQRQLLAVARALRDRPRLLILDEPTAALGVAESSQVEDLTASLPGQGTAVLLVSHDVEQMFRLANRIVVLRHGRVVANVYPELSHPDEVAALLSGQPVDVSARRQLSRLHVLSDQLASAEPSSSLSLILAALAAALGHEQLLIHVRDGGRLRLAGSMGVPLGLSGAWLTLPVGLAGGQIGRAAAVGREVISADLEAAPGWARYRPELRRLGVRSAWSVPFTAASGVTGVITVFGADPGTPTGDELDLASLYAGYAAGALERDRLLGEVRDRNRVLETIRDMLETLAGPASLADGLVVTLRALRSGLGATEVGILARDTAGDVACRACVGADGEPCDPSPEALDAARAPLHPDGSPAPLSSGVRRGRGRVMAVEFQAPGGPTSLVARWSDGDVEPDQGALMEDAAYSLRLALEREASEHAKREAMALRSSQELQRKFLSWLSHELRTPLTAIRGYASSLMQPDVKWDADSQRRFLTRIGGESARLGRLVDDLLDFSAIDAGILRLQRDWCDLALVLEAARGCLPAPGPEQVELHCPPTVPAIWADHDRLEQVFVNLLDNAIRHNPPGTAVTVEASLPSPGQLSVSVTDDGPGMALRPAGPGSPVQGVLRSLTAGTGLGLSIAKGIVDAHGGTLEFNGQNPGTRCVVRLPVALGAPPGDASSDA